MAKSDKTTAPIEVAPTGSNPLADVDDGLRPGHQRSSPELIRDAIMRGGGEPFGEPMGFSLQSLTTKIVKRLGQRGFFGFAVWEKVRARQRRNKFTKHGASRYRGPLAPPPPGPEGGKKGSK